MLRTQALVACQLLAVFALVALLVVRSPGTTLLRLRSGRKHRDPPCPWRSDIDKHAFVYPRRQFASEVDRFLRCKDGNAKTRWKNLNEATRRW